MAPEQSQNANGRTFNSAAKRPKWGEIAFCVQKPRQPTARRKLNAEVRRLLAK